MAAISHTTDRPRSLVSHLIHLSGTDPVTARKFIDASGKAALARLGIRPAVKARTRTTVHGRHRVISLVDRASGEKRTKHVRPRKPGHVYRYTLDQVAAVLTDMKPRKAEYKELRETALATLATPPVTLRRLPRHKKWSKRR